MSRHPRSGSRSHHRPLPIRRDTNALPTHSSRWHRRPHSLGEPPPTLHQFRRGWPRGNPTPPPKNSRRVARRSKPMVAYHGPDVMHTSGHFHAPVGHELLWVSLIVVDIIGKWGRVDGTRRKPISSGGASGVLDLGPAYLGDRRSGELRANFSRDYASVLALALFALRYNPNTPSVSIRAAPRAQRRPLSLGLSPW
jgi:hypothetical protein